LLRDPPPQPSSTILSISKFSLWSSSAYDVSHLASDFRPKAPFCTAGRISPFFPPPGKPLACLNFPPWDAPPPPRLRALDFPRRWSFPRIGLSEAWPMFPFYFPPRHGTFRATHQRPSTTLSKVRIPFIFVPPLRDSCEHLLCRNPLLFFFFFFFFFLVFFFFFFFFFWFFFVSLFFFPF